MIQLPAEKSSHCLRRDDATELAAIVESGLTCGLILEMDSPVENLNADKDMHTQFLDQPGNGFSG